MPRRALRVGVPVSALVAAVAFVGIAQPFANADEPKPTAPVTADQLDAIGPYVKTGADHRQRLDATGARNAGIDPATVASAADIVKYQNTLLDASDQQNQSDVTKLVQLPSLTKLLGGDSLAINNAPGGTSPLRNRDRRREIRTHACGTISNPVPDRTPRLRQYGPYQDVAGYLLARGYHRTDGTVTGSPRAESQFDFTKGRDYTSEYGFCPAPAFRDQAHISSSDRRYFYEQRGEPNPELRAYTWPYWNWGTYVTWWHANH